jgi:hypothetical protein
LKLVNVLAPIPWLLISSLFVLFNKLYSWL